MDYSVKLKDPRWQKKRLKIFARDKFTCQMCGDDKSTLVIHHIKYLLDKEPWEHPNKLLITICEDCHKKVHGKTHIPTIREIIKLSRYEIEDEIIPRIAKQPIKEVLQSLKAGREAR
jgi:5-methylcytosine-specific restriction endonuclease McrA